MNRIHQLFENKKKNILSIYFTAGHPELDATEELICLLEKSGADMLEIGMPFSDPLADGPVIQQSSQKALANGMNLKLLFAQLTDIRQKVQIPLLLMGYLNPVMHYGIENFCRDCHQAGIDGVILPDLPLEEYESSYKSLFEKYDLKFIFLISPQTSDDRLKQIDRLSSGFIYMVSSSSTTGAKTRISDAQKEYFSKVNALKLKNPLVVGFGISNRETFREVCQYASGAIIGSAFVRMLDEEEDWRKGTEEFVKRILTSLPLS
jgi:tryptophan synthase alpha chain